jgi:chromosome segregation protein
VTAVADLVEVSPELSVAIQRLLGGYALVEDLESAEQLVDSHPDLIAVTRSGDVLGAAVASGGSVSGPSLLEVQAAADEAREQLAAASAAADRARFELVRAEDERDEARARVDVALAQLHESDAAMAAVAERLAQLGALARSAREECTRLTRAQEQAQAGRDRDATLCLELEQRLAAVDAGEVVEEPDTARLQRLAEVASAARSAETDARLALRTAEERARAWLDAPTSSPAPPGRHERSATAPYAGTSRCSGMSSWPKPWWRPASRSAAPHRLLAAGPQCPHLRRVGARRGDCDVHALRERSRDLASQLHELTDSVHRDEVARAEQRLRIEALEERVGVELGLDPEALVAEYGPQQPVPVLTEHAEDNGSSDASRFVPYDRAEQVARMRKADRALAELGRVNPLALEEFSALEERHAFLTEQMEDLARPVVTCSTSSATSTRASRRSSPRRTPTSSASSATCSAGCSPAAQGGWCSPSRTTCWPVASRSRPARPARR